MYSSLNEYNIPAITSFFPLSSIWMPENYPLPNIKKFLATTEICVRPFLSESRLRSYQEAVKLLFSPPKELHKTIAAGSFARLEELDPGSENCAMGGYAAQIRMSMLNLYATATSKRCCLLASQWLSMSA